MAVDPDIFAKFSTWLDSVGAFTASFKHPDPSVQWTPEDVAALWAAHDGRLAFLSVDAGRSHAVVLDDLVEDEGGEGWTAAADGRRWVFGLVWTADQDARLAAWGRFRDANPDEVEARGRELRAIVGLADEEGDG